MIILSRSRSRQPRRSVKKEKAPDFDQVVAGTLNLWKVSIPYKDVEELKSKRHPEDIEGSEELKNEMLPLSEALGAPLHMHLHIIVQRPEVASGARKRYRDSGNESISPTKKQHRDDDVDGIATVDKKISEISGFITNAIKMFLENPKPRDWVPLDCVTDPDVHKFFTELRLPAYRNGNPSLLYHDLHNSDDIGMKEMAKDDGPGIICNTSGSGKTRRLLELLAKNWGFYFVTSVDATNQVGITDLVEVLEGFQDRQAWTNDLEKVDAVEREEASARNVRIASRAFKQILAARIVLFKLFLETVTENGGELKEDHRRIWLLFQLFNKQPQTSPHPCSLVKHCLSKAGQDVLDILIYSIELLQVKYLHSTVIIGLDEAQRAIRIHPRAFLSSQSNTKCQSTLCGLTRVFSMSSSFKLIVSGTGMSMSDLIDNMGSGVSKLVDEIRFYHELGMFDTWPKLEPYLRRYIPPSVLDSDSGKLLQKRIREYLLGRYRFSVSFVEYLLRNGMQSPHTLLNEYVKSHTNCLPGDIGKPFVDEEPKLRVQPHVMGFEWDKLRNDAGAFREAARIVQSHLTKGQAPTYGDDSVRLVEYGIAYLRDRHSGHIIEPLAFLSVMKWLETEEHSLTAGIRDRLASQESRGIAYQELIVLYLFRVLRRPTSFRTIFNFYGIPPSWAGNAAQIVARLDGVDVDVNVLDNPLNPNLGVTHYASDIKGILSWIEPPPSGSPSAPAALIPGNLFGPDILIRCGDVLVIGQLKSYLDSNKESLDATTTSEAIASLNPDHWFKKKDKEERDKLISAIKKHRVLYFVGGYPLPPDLDSTAKSVKKAIAGLGNDVVLASLRIDTFRSHFVSRPELRNLLEPLDHALQKKRESMTRDEARG